MSLSKEKWNVEASLQSKSTVNKIRNIVDKLDMKSIPKDKTFITMAIGDPTKYPNLKPAQNLIENVQSIIRINKQNGLNESEGLFVARKALAKKYQVSHILIDENDIFITHGCSGAIDITVNSLLNEGDNILLPRPGFSFYETVCGRYGFEPRFYRLIPEKEWDFDFQHLESLIDKKTKAILVNNPSNPCGSIFSKKSLLKLISIAEKYDIPIIADEIYSTMIFEDAEIYPIASLTTKLPVISLSGVAKQYLVPGWRVGWIIVYDPLKRLTKVKQSIVQLCNISFHPCSLVQAALPNVLFETPSSYYKELNHILYSQSKLFYDLCLENPYLAPVRAKGAMYIMIGIRINLLKDIENDIQFAQLLLREEALLVLPGTIFGFPNYFRAVICPPINIIQEAGSRLKTFCQRHAKTQVQARL